MKQIISDLIVEYVDKIDRIGKKESYFRHPVVRFGDANHPGLLQIKEKYDKNLLLPEEVLSGAKTLITYFIPLNSLVAESNREGEWSSKEWILSYGRTYDIIYELNQKIVAFLEENGYRAVAPDEAFTCDPVTHRSRWSLRQIGYYSGLGTIGMHNILITPAGCCGRIASLVTDWDCEHDSPVETEYCLHKRDGSCGACMERCVSGALTADGYDEKQCDEYNEKTDLFHRPQLCRYVKNSGQKDLPDGSSCGKCTVALPCTHFIPR